MTEPESEIVDTFNKLYAEAEQLKADGELGAWWDMTYRLTGLRAAVDIIKKHYNKATT